MRSALILLAVSLILGGVGHANHLEILAELATLGVLVALAGIVVNGWRQLRGRTSEPKP